ncbi:MAG TPA: cytochrome c biogenesis protein CcdA [Saprospiraceae bacterium]|nr:cytochrome c biogenesis protein CcdA [Saprospiraceae bacterium]
MKHFILLFFVWFLGLTIQAQNENPVKWKFEIEKSSVLNEFKLKYTAKVDKGWTIYSQYTSDDGPVPTSINYEAKDGMELIGKATESGYKKEGMDPLFEVNVIKFLADKPFVIEQKISVKDPKKPIIGYVNYMACDSKKCLPPTDVEFSFIIPSENKSSSDTKGSGSAGMAIGEMQKDPVDTLSTPSTLAIDTMAKVSNDFAVGAIINGDKIDQKVSSLVSTYKNPLSNCGGTEEKKEGLFWTFFLGLIGGFIALLTPCVFPMLPITVSFFTKDTKRKGWVNGLIYGASIIVIYVVIGILITKLLGPEALNKLSTDWIANTLFFLIFIAFAFSFFGYYEITLPSTWSTKSDRMADKGGLIGIFFMAFTLALVSFSCTGPIIGTALVEASDSTLGPAVVMLGFSTGLALPFGLFAAFPAWLNTLPKSGSWMNSVKVVLGFLELALAFKFLSVADMTSNWGILKYEFFMGIWIVVFTGMALYLFGVFKFPHDSPIKKLSTTRMTLGALVIVFVLYLASGFRINEKTGDYTALTLMSGLAPPANYNFFLKPKEVDAEIKAKYPSYSKCANNINCFKDYFEGMAYAKEVNKSVLLDFTGYGCVNCRKTEEHIWVDDRIRKILNQDLVLISLYADDRKTLSKVYISSNSGVKLRTVGSKWADFQKVNFEQITQPLYVMATNNQEVISKPRGFVEGIDGYLEFLECSLKEARNQ